MITDENFEKSIELCNKDSKYQMFLCNKDSKCEGYDFFKFLRAGRILPGIRLSGLLKNLDFIDRYLMSNLELGQKSF